MTEAVERNADTNRPATRPFMNLMFVLSGARRILGFMNMARPQTGSSLGRTAMYHWDTSSRVSIQAVNIDVAIPIVMVTANPLTGPDPNANSITCDRNVAALESKIVAYAR